mgnify:CR=1 FL=1
MIDPTFMLAGLDEDPVRLIGIGAAGFGVLLLSGLVKSQASVARWKRRARSAENDLQELKSRALFEDPATGLGNQNQLDVDCGKLVGRQRRHGEPFSLGILEVENVFRPTDGLSPAALNAASQVILNASRLEDSVCRLGDRTFGVLLAQADVAGANVFLERVRAMISSHPWKDGNAMVYLSVTGGIAQWTDEMHSTRDLVMAAVAARESYRNELERQQRRFAPQISA